jgi:hypothetical protein
MNDNVYGGQGNDSVYGEGGDDFVKTRDTCRIPTTPTAARTPTCA